MKSVSFYLQQYIQQYPELHHNIKFSTLSRSFISQLFHQIHQSHLQWNEDYEPIFSSEKTWALNSATIPNYEYIPETIRKKWIEQISRETLYQKTFTIIIGYRTFHIYLWFPTIVQTEQNTPILMSNLQIQEKVTHTLQKIYLWLRFVSTFLHKHTKCSQTVNIYLFLTNHLKTVPTHSYEPIHQQHVNTAFTTSCISKTTDIFVFREEEWFKVLIHETFHNLGLDFIDADNSNINKSILELFPISVRDLRLYETYSEMWGEIMNILFIVYWTEPPAKKGRLPIVRWTQMAEQCFEIEQAFSLFQAHKILCLHKLKYNDLFVAEKAAQYSEQTQIFCYYILKSIWMHHINSFLEFCANQPGGSSLKFQLSQKNIEKYVQLLKHHAQQPEFLQKMNQISLIVLHKKKRGESTKHGENTKHGEFIHNTLRMTLHEF